MNHIFKSILRNFIRKPVTNLINLIGLSVSLTLVIILSVYCYSELTTDSHHINGDRVYIYGLSEDRLYTPGILKDNIDQNVAGVETAVRIGGSWVAPVFQVDNKEPLTSDLIYADEGFFRLFTYKALEGNLESALKEPLTIVITKPLAEKLFGKEKALNRSIKVNNAHVLTVAAVVEQPKNNSCLTFSAITSMEARKTLQPEEGEFTKWNQCNFQTYLLLRKGADPLETSKAIFSLYPERDKKKLVDQSLVPLKKIYYAKFTLFGSNYLRVGDKKKVMILVLVASLVLIIALVNFINISSSQWMEKIKQTGILKVIGATQRSIMLDVLAESFIFFFAALLIAVDLVNALSSFIYGYTGITYNPGLTYSTGFIIISVGLIFILSVLSTIIPAARISSSRAVDNLKKSASENRSRTSGRGILVTLQFAIAIVLIAFTLIVQKQVKFGSGNLGFNQDNVIGIKLTEQLSAKKEVLKDALMKEPEIGQISFSQYYPGKNISEWGSSVDLKGETRELSFDTFSADADFFKILGLKTVQGRLYTDDLLSDAKKAVVNETFLRQHNLTDPIGCRILSGPTGYEIIGVIKDFHYKSVNQPIAPLVIRNDSWSSYCLLKMRTTDFNSLNKTIVKVKKAVSELSPSFPVEVSFLDQAIQDMYQSELNFRRTFSLLSGCAIVICCMGILAMSIFSCQRRVKEIGIRKTNGAKIFQVLAMLNGQFVKWVFIAFLISIPVAWYIMDQWLKNFAYKTELSWWIFLLSGIIALVIAMFTVSWQSWRAAAKNPVEALRYE